MTGARTQNTTTTQLPSDSLSHLQKTALPVRLQGRCMKCSSLTSSDATPAASWSGWLTNTDPKTSIMLPRSKSLDPSQILLLYRGCESIHQTRATSSLETGFLRHGGLKERHLELRAPCPSMLPFTQILSAQVLRSVEQGYSVFQKRQKYLKRYPITEHCPARGHDFCYFGTAVPLTSLSKPQVFILYGDTSVHDAAWGQQATVSRPQKLGCRKCWYKQIKWFYVDCQS